MEGQSTVTREGNKSLKFLRRFAKPQLAQEQCGLCSLPLEPTHRHLLEMSTGRPVCACDGCALSFECVKGGRFKLIPRDARLLTAFQLSDELWNDLALPINLVFISPNSRAGKISAIYPSPAGGTESFITEASWKMMVKDNPTLANVDADVEALLINRVGEAHDYFIAPIDTCYELVGIIRTHWRGLSGGSDVWQEIEKFFRRLREKSKSAPTQVEEEAYA